MSFTFEYEGQELSSWGGDDTNWPSDSLGALKASIAKWEAIEEYIDVHGALPDVALLYSCALCRLYYFKKNEEHKIANCTGCPIAESTGLSHCKGTPYTEFEYFLEDEPSFFLPSKRMTQAMTLVRSEIAFLKSLLGE